tara:strand:+ start:475 stop:819 length:345 start_codon:yes stop_codon:yes gene_type:complete
MTPEEKVFIVENRFDLTQKEIANYLGYHKSNIQIYMDKHELGIGEEAKEKRRGERISKAKKKPLKRVVQGEGKIDKAIIFAKQEGYANITQAFAKEGKSKFMKRFEAQNMANSN